MVGHTFIYSTPVRKIKAIVDSGVTVEQLEAIRGPGGKKDDKNFKAKMLEEIKKAGAENPGSGNETKPGEGKDFMSQVTAYMQAKEKCTKAEAIQAVSKLDPKAHEAWIMEQQGGSVH